MKTCLGSGKVSENIKQYIGGSMKFANGFQQSTIDEEQFFPTPPELARKMVQKIVGWPTDALDPSAGEGALLETVAEKYRYDRSHTMPTFYALEINSRRRAILTSKRHNVIGEDFLAWSAPDQFDLIIMNPPFNDGASHLLKAIDILYSGQILCLLNAETLRNPFTNERKYLAKRLEELSAEVEYIENGFSSAERQTEVEVALINIVVSRKIEEDLFAGCNVADAVEPDSEIPKEKAVADPRRKLEELVKQYNQQIDACRTTIIEYYRNYSLVHSVLRLNEEVKDTTYNVRIGRVSFDDIDLTAVMKRQLNDTVRLLRKLYWRNALDLPEIRSRMTTARNNEFEGAISNQCHYDFTEENIRTFLINLIAGFDSAVMKSIIDLFDLITVQHAYYNHNGLRSNNIHLYNGWKTNKAFKVGKKFILPFNAYDDTFNKWRLDYTRYENLIDMNVVMNYLSDFPSFSGLSCLYGRDLNTILEYHDGKNVDLGLLTVTAYKKGTMHFTFNDEAILRRFNVAAAIGKGWLPMDYGQKPYESMPDDEKDAVDAFEGKDLYTKHLGDSIIHITGASSILPALPYFELEKENDSEVVVDAPQGCEVLLDVTEEAEADELESLMDFLEDL